MFRLLWFIVGIVIGSWIARPASAPPPEKAPTPEGEPPAKVQSFRAAPATERKQASASSDAPAKADSLLDIKGIGLVAFERLTELGITMFAQLADETPESLAEKMGGRTTAERIRREDWIGQAKASIKKQ